MNHSSHATRNVLSQREQRMFVGAPKGIFKMLETIKKN